MVSACVSCWESNGDGKQGNHTFQLLFKHGVSPCLATMRIRCQADLNSFPLGELEETTRTFEISDLIE